MKSTSTSSGVSTAASVKLCNHLQSAAAYLLPMLRIIDTAQHCSRSHDAVIRVYDDTGNVIETHEHKGDFKSGERYLLRQKAAMRSSTTAHCFGLVNGLAIIHDRLRCGFVHFKLCAH